MRLPVNDDVNAIGIHLNELKSQFDQAMREGHSMDEIKVIYTQIKELECHWNALNWNPATHPPRRTSAVAGRRYPHVEETPPLL